MRSTSPLNTQPDSPKSLLRDVLGGLLMGSVAGLGAVGLSWLLQDKSDASSDFLLGLALSWLLVAEALVLWLKPPRSRAWAIVSILALRWPFFIWLLTQAPGGPNEPYGDPRALLAIMGLASSALVHVPAMVRANILRSRPRPKATAFMDD